MFKRLSKFVLALLVAVSLLISLRTTPVYAGVAPEELAKAVEAIENLDGLRRGLASTLEGQTTEPTGQTFKEVCKPVGMQAKKLSEENGWQVKQIANKYRNPAHAPDNLHAKMALAQFEQNPELMGFWEPETIDNNSGFRYYRRINVEASCLACHGLKNSRPQFVKDKYPQDLAFDFKEGDLRGMYAVFIPEIQAALEEK
ncbi:hypothetical protein B9S53_07620 [Arthrospira sp. O9.13F]|nr:hypothetical protein B9S53_07620 [Arthrospira sp. O9.13F]